MAKTSQDGSAQFCGQCGAALLPDAKFCATCGATVQAGSPAATEVKSGSRLWLAVVAGVILVGAIAVVFLLSQRQQPAPSTAVLPAAPAQQNLPYPGVARVSAGDAHGAANAGQAVIVDVRDRESYDQAHIAGAISIPENELAARTGELPEDRQILTYCTWPAEESSARVAQYLLDLGYTDVAAIQGGLQSWIDAGLPAEGA